MIFDGLDTGATCRALAAILQQPGDDAELYLERLTFEEVARRCGQLEVEQRHEEGFAVRFLRGTSSWHATGDDFAPGALDEAIRLAARVHPRTPRPLAHWRPAAAPQRDLGPLLAAVERLGAEVSPQADIVLRRHERQSRVLGPQLAAPEQRERFLSLTIREGRVSYSGLFAPEQSADLVEHALAELEARRRFAEAHLAADAGPSRVLLAPDAAAVVLHEAVAHALETDILAIGGRPEAAIGLRLASEILDVLDDPAAAPSSVCRASDDEGVPVMRRWLVRGGIVELPLADRRGAHGSDRLVAGAARRASRHDRPGPRSTFLEVPEGSSPSGDLVEIVGEGLLITAVDRGALDPTSGRFVLDLPGARRIRAGTVAETLGPCRLVGRVADLLAGISTIGDRATLAGAGWCAKDGQLLGVWARTPALVIERGLEVVS